MGCEWHLGLGFPRPSSHLEEQLFYLCLFLGARVLAHDPGVWNISGALA